MAEPAFRSARVTANHPSLASLANRSPSAALMIMQSTGRWFLRANKDELMTQPHQIFRIVSITMLIALAPLQGQAQSTDDMEGQHAYPPLLHELGVPLFSRARVIEIESAFTGERGGRLVIATQKGSPVIRRFF